VLGYIFKHVISAVKTSQICTFYVHSDSFSMSEKVFAAGIPSWSPVLPQSH